MDQIGSTPHEGVGSYFQLFLLYRLSTSINCLQKHIMHIRHTKKIFENLACFFSPETTKQVLQMTNSEDPDEIPHDVTFHQLRSALKEINIFLKNIIFDPLIYIMDHPDLTCFKENSIGLNRFDMWLLMKK